MDKKNERRLHYKNISSSLNEKNPFYIRTILIRHAFRVFPYVARDKHFEFWKKSDKPISKNFPISTFPEDKGDDRAKQLLSIFFVLHEFWSNISSFKDNDGIRLQELLNDLKEVSERFFTYLHPGGSGHTFSLVQNMEVSNLDAYAPVIYLSDIVRDVVHDSEVERLFIDLASAIDTSEDETIYQNDLYLAAENTVKLFDKDIELAREMEYSEFVKKDIWGNGISKYEKKLYKDYFILAIENLIENTEELFVKESLRKIVDYYLSVINKFQSDYKPTNKIRFESGGEGDQLNRDVLVKSLSNFLTEPNNNGHLTIGLMGFWGSGKTRVLDLLKAELKRKLPFYLANLMLGLMNTVKIFKQEWHMK